MLGILKTISYLFVVLLKGIYKRIKYYLSYIRCLYTIFSKKYVFDSQTLDRKLILKAFNLHHKVRQMYGNKVYFFHVLDVLNIGKHYGVNLDTAIVILFHDTIEDCGITYNNLSEIIGKENALSVIRCTEFSRGLNRDERKPQWFYDELRQDTNASIAKLCDITANMNNSYKNKHRMFKKYCKEWKTKVSVIAFPPSNIITRIFYNISDLANEKVSW